MFTIWLARKFWRSKIAIKHLILLHAYTVYSGGSQNFTAPSIGSFRQKLAEIQIRPKWTEKNSDRSEFEQIGRF